LINVWYGSYWPTQTTLSQGGKLVYLQEENPYSWGRKNPMSHLSRMKKPDLPYLHVAAALRAYSTSSSLDVLNSLGTTASLSSLSKAGVHYVPARPCRSIAVHLLLPYLDRPLCAISCWPLPYTPCLPPPRAIEGVRGIYPF
jgi:hypothetical protein